MSVARCSSKCVGKIRKDQQAARASDTTSFFYMGRLIESGATRQMFTAPAQDQTEAYITGRFG